MKRIKKIIVLTIVCLLSVSIFGACARVDTTSPATIILNIITPLNASDITVTSSSGTVSSDDKKFTIALENRRPSVVSISSDGYETVVLSFTAKDFVSSATFKRDVEFSKLLETVIKLNFNCASSVTLSADSNVSVKNKKNKFTLTTPGRDKTATYKYTATAENFEKYEGVIKGEDIINGQYSEQILLAPKGKKVLKCCGLNSNVLVTERFRVIYGEGEQNAQDPYKYNYTFLLNADDKVVVPIKNGYQQIIRGSEIPTYGTLTDALNEDNRNLMREKLYINPTNEVRYGSLMYVKIGDEYMPTNVEEEEIFDDAGGRRRASFIPLSENIELHSLERNFKDTGIRHIYKFTEQELVDSLKSPIDATLENTLLLEDMLLLEHTREEDTYRRDIKKYDYTTKNEIIGEVQDGYQNIVGSEEYNGTDIIITDWYNKNFNFECKVDFGGFEPTDYEISANSAKYTGDMLKDGAYTVLNFENTNYNRSFIFNVYFSRLVTLSNGAKTAISSEPFSFDYKDFVAIGDKIKLKTPIVLNNYSSIEEDYFSNRLDFYKVLNIPYDPNDPNTRLFPQIDVVLVNESDGASIFSKQSQYNYNKRWYFSPNALFKIKYTFGLRERTVTLTATKDDNGAPLSCNDLVAFHEARLYQQTDPDQLIDYPFTLKP